MNDTFADPFNLDGNDTKTMNNKNPFDLTSSRTDPFGISSNMTLSKSVEEFDDNPFLSDTEKDQSIQPRSSKDALSSSNWFAYQRSINEAYFDQLDYIQDKSSIIQFNSVNFTNSFLFSRSLSNTEQSNETPSPVSPIFLLFNVNTDRTT